MIVHETTALYMFTFIGHFKSDLFISFCLGFLDHSQRKFEKNAPTSFSVTA
jgi:hypothetical protein